MREGYEYADALPDGPVRGRGAGLNPGNRFERVRLHVLGEHLDAMAREQQGEAPYSHVELHHDNERSPGAPHVNAGPAPTTRQVKTQVLPDATRTIINRVDPAKSPDLPLRWTLNPYRGCEHGCIYCYARPTHEYAGLSSGLDFETRILAKHDAPTLLRKELAHPRWAGEPIAMAGVTDIYQPIEAKLKLTRRCLEVMAEARQPVGLVTKNRLITRDLDLLRRLNEHRAVHAAISLTTLDKRIAAGMEPRASSPGDRLRAIEALSEAGIPVAVMVAPVVPGVTDREIPAILQAAAGAGAVGAGYVLLRLPYQVKALFLDWLKREMPERAGHVESLIRAGRGGELYDARHGARHRGTGEVAAQIRRVFEVFRRRHGLAKGWPPLSGAAFRPPASGGQMRLF